MSGEIIDFTPKQRRINDALMKGFSSESEEAQRIVYSHSTMCQTCLPINDMGNLREWESKNGDASLLLQAGKVHDKELDKWVDVGLPFGTKPRLIMMYLNRQAVMQKSPVITVEDTLRQFIQSVGIDPNGRNYRAVKEQLGRLSMSHLAISKPTAKGSIQKHGQVIDAMELWFTKDGEQRTLWPSTIRLSDSYFESLQKHSVPLDAHALGLLKNSALELDLYVMLAERLHRIATHKPQFIPWALLYQQYGHGYSRIDNFRTRFKKALDNVKGAYFDARLEECFTEKGRSKGIALYFSQPPVAKLMMSNTK
jgi:hypothetical protein